MAVIASSPSLYVAFGGLYTGLIRIWLGEYPGENVMVISNGLMASAWFWGGREFISQPLPLSVPDDTYLVQYLPGEIKENLTLHQRCAEFEWAIAGSTNLPALYDDQVPVGATCQALIDSAVAPLNTQITTLNTQIGSLNTQILTLNAQLTTAQAELTAAIAEISDLEQQLAYCQARLEREAQAVDRQISAVMLGSMAQDDCDCEPQPSDCIERSRIPIIR